MRLSELLFLGALAGFAGVTLYGGLSMPFTSGVTFGPGFLPVIMAVAILAIGAVIVLRGVLRPAQANDPASPPTGNILPVAMAVGLIALTLVASAMGTLLLPLGVSMLVVTMVLLRRSFWIAILSTVTTLAAIYAIFALWLHIPIT